MPGDAGRTTSAGAPVSPAAGARTLHGERAAALRARRQQVDEARLDAVEAAVRAVERRRHSRRVEPLGRAAAPRQREDRPRPLGGVVDRALPGRDRLVQFISQRLADAARGTRAHQRPEHLLEARAGRGEQPPGLGRRGARLRVRRLAGRFRGVGERLVRVRGRARPACEQSERLRLVHHGRSTGGRQVGEAPPVAKGRGRDDVRGVRGRRSRRARRGSTVDDLDRFPVLAERRGIDEQHAGRVPLPEQLHAHPCKVLFRGLSTGGGADGATPASLRRGCLVQLAARSRRRRGPSTPSIPVGVPLTSGLGAIAHLARCNLGVERGSLVDHLVWFQDARPGLPPRSRPATRFLACLCGPGRLLGGSGADGLRSSSNSRLVTSQSSCSAKHRTSARSP